MKNADMPATPVTQEPFPVGAVNKHYGQLMSGLTKREHFAAIAMQGLLTCAMDTDCTIPELCADAVLAADALLAELEK